MADILLVDPDQVAADAMAAALRQRGHEVRLADSVSTAQAALDYQEPDAIMTELALPDMDGLVFLSDLSRLHPKAALMVVASGMKRADRVVAFRLGADAVLDKKTDDSELITRIEAVLRRVIPRPPATHDSALRIDDLVINVRSGVTTLSGRLVNLTPTEYRLLVVLAQHPDEVVSREQLHREVWGCEDYMPSNKIDTHMGRIRRKLGRSGSRIVAMWGRGFVLQTAAAQLKEVV